ncbi:MAG TPA: PGF-pre-PGF domain-containing protein, partial [Methanocorpusculum sp.]|nr:PGF-pre-PGF domain-containing protein [Methanocorpusculum sp.]
LTVKNSVGTGMINSTFTSYNAIFNVTNGSLTLEDKVLIELNNATADNEGFIVTIKGSSDEKESSYSNFVLNKGAELRTNAKAALIIRESVINKFTPAYGVNVDIHGLINISGRRGIQLNGVVTHENINSPNVTQIHIYDGAKIIAKNSTKDTTDECVGIYAAGYGNWVFEPGCKVIGHDAITIKSGKFEFKGGEFIGNGKYSELSSEEGDEGENICGIALKIVGCSGNYQGNVSIDITGGTFTSEKNSAVLYQNVNGCRDNLTRLAISGSPVIKTNADKYPINITNVTGKNVSVTIGGQTPFYPGLNTSSATWVKDAKGNWNVTLNKDINNVESIDLRHVPNDKKVTLKKGSYHFVKVSNDDKYSFDGWNDGTSDLGASTEIFYGKKVYTPIFTYIKQYDTGEEVEDDEPTPTIEPTPIVTPTQNQTAKPTVKPTPEPKTVVIVETEVKFEDNKVITSITVPEGSSGSITFTQTEEKGMDEWIPESIEDSYSFDLSCDGEINGDSEIHFVMSDVILKSLGLTPEDVCLKHFEDGVWVKLKISYIILDDGTYYYTAVTKSFSPFEISFDAKSEEPTVTPTDEQPTKSPVPIVGLLAGLCVTALVLRRK